MRCEMIVYKIVMGILLSAVLVYWARPSRMTSVTYSGTASAADNAAASNIRQSKVNFFIFQVLSVRSLTVNIRFSGGRSRRSLFRIGA